MTQQYEFCELRRSTSKPGYGIVKRSGSDLARTTEDFFSSLISQLGNAGWEMTGIDPNGVMYFQRPLPKPSLKASSVLKTRVMTK